MALSKLEQFLYKQGTYWGSKFSPDELYPQFHEAFNSGDRIEVEFVNSNGEVYETKRGRVAASGGWRPVFLLMLTKRSTGSIWTLGPNDRVARIVSRSRQ